MLAYIVIADGCRPCLLLFKGTAVVRSWLSVLITNWSILHGRPPKSRHRLDAGTAGDGCKSLYLLSHYPNGRLVPPPSTDVCSVPAVSPGFGVISVIAGGSESSPVPGIWCEMAARMWAAVVRVRFRREHCERSRCDQWRRAGDNVIPISEPVAENIAGNW